MSVDHQDDRVARVRDFNRFYTRLIGVLQAGLLETPYSLTEARTIFELAQEKSVDLVELRAAVGIDGGYMSRVLARLESQHLAKRERSVADGRRQIVALTEQGRAAFETLDQRARAQVADLLAPLVEEDQRRLLEAMSTIRDLLEPARPRSSFVLRAPESGDYGWVVQRHGALYAHEYGWDEQFEALVARIVADYIDHRDPKRERAWIADLDGSPAGCVFCVRKDDRTAQLRLLLVEPAARGSGIGTRLVDECVRFAKRARYDRMVLWTNDVLLDARRVYERAGFKLVEEDAHHSFGQDLVGQTWERPL